MSSQSRATLAALDKLESVVAGATADLEVLRERIDSLREELLAGRPLSELVSDPRRRPLIIEQLTELLDRLGDASGGLRRAEAHQLRAEGYTQARIAATFGVSRQRAATLLAARRRLRTGP